MPNRILKESICRSEEIDQLSWFEEALFYRLIVNCDDYGRFDGRTKIIKSFCFPLKEIKETDLEKALCHLSAAGLVVRYEVEDKPVLQLATWERHQQIRAKRAKYPGMDSECAHLISNDINCEHEKSDDGKCPRNPIQSNTNPNTNPNPIQKLTFGENQKVKLTEEEVQKLNNEFGEPETLDAIAFLDAYIAEKGYRSKSHYLAMRRWVFDAVEEKKAKKKPASSNNVFEAWDNA